MKRIDVLGKQLIAGDHVVLSEVMAGNPARHTPTDKDLQNRRKYGIVEPHELDDQKLIIMGIGMVSPKVTEINPDTEYCVWRKE